MSIFYEMSTFYDTDLTRLVPDNETIEEPRYITVIKRTNKIVLTCILTFLMVAMGSVVTLEDFKVALRRPIGVFIGFGCQFFLMPLSAFCLAHILGLESAKALGVLIIASSPGGAMSNLYTYWSNGDVCLSIAMTTISTVAALFMMPFNLWLYSRSWTNQKAVIPYTSIFTALALVLIPAALGMMIRWKKPKWAAVVTQIGSVLGLAGICLNITFNRIINPTMFVPGWNVWVAAIVLPFVGYILGYVFALLLRQPQSLARTIAFETGAQNVAIALSLVAITFEGTDILNDVFVYPSLYGVTLIVEALILTLCFRLYDKKCVTNITAHDEEERAPHYEKVMVTEGQAGADV